LVFIGNMNILQTNGTFPAKYITNVYITITISFSLRY